MPKVSIALTGDTILQRRVSTCEDQQFLAAVDAVRAADVGFTNLEGCIQAGEDWHAHVAGNGRAATYIRTPTYVGDELSWLGFRLLSLANNHAADFGEGGILSTLRYLEPWPGLVAAGIGPTLAAASAPRYLDTPGGVVALIAAADWGPRGIGDLAFPPPIGALAADADRYFKGRPGLNLVRYDCTFTVPEADLAHLRRMSAEMGWEDSKRVRRGGGGRAEPLTSPSPSYDEDESDGGYYFMGRKFVAGDDFGFRTVAHPGDVDRIVRAVEEARRNADWVVVSFHQQGAGRSREEPVDHTVSVGRAAAAAGADVFVSHGAGRMNGIELAGDSSVAVYGPGSFIIQLDQVKQLPLEMLERGGLGYHDEAGQLLALRSRREGQVGTEVRMNPSQAEAGLNSITVVTLESGRPPQVEVVPIELVGPDEGRLMSGLPRLIPADDERRELTFAVVSRRSRAFGTEIGADGRARPVRVVEELSASSAP
jgi:poly-gamma-glutamate capsule biosynthesis protein CapA/YwtB (metallophosphatase superfamily)